MLQVRILKTPLLSFVFEVLVGNITMQKFTYVYDKFSLNNYISNKPRSHSIQLTNHLRTQLRPIHMLIWPLWRAQEIWIVVIVLDLVIRCYILPKSNIVYVRIKVNRNLTHWGRVTHIYVGNLIIIGSDNGLSPGRRQAIIWTNAGILLIGPLGTNFSEILIGIQTFSFKKMLLKMSSAKWRPFVSASMC